MMPSPKQPGGGKRQRRRGVSEFADEPLLESPDWWKVVARARIREKFGRQDVFARHIGGSQAGVCMALSEKQRYSRAVGPMSDALGIPRPVPAHQTELLAELYALVVKMSAEQQAELLEKFETMQRVLGDLQPPKSSKK